METNDAFSCKNLTCFHDSTKKVHTNVTKWWALIIDTPHNRPKKYLIHKKKGQHTYIKQIKGVGEEGEEVQRQFGGEYKLAIKREIKPYNVIWVGKQ